MATPYATIVRNVVSSTQDIAAAELSRNGHSVLVIAHQQTAGRGRTGNEWWQAERGIAASLALPVETPTSGGTLPLAVGLAVRRAISEVSGRDAGLKWPNDIVLDSNKIGGILVERKDGAILIGCGLNLFWPEAPDGAGALLESDPGAEFGPSLAQRWVEMLTENGFEWDRNAYLDACTTIGTRVAWDPNGEGIAMTVAADGGLVVETRDGLVTLRSGQVRSIRPASGGA